MVGVACLRMATAILFMSSGISAEVSAGAEPEATEVEVWATPNNCTKLFNDYYTTEYPLERFIIWNGTQQTVLVMGGAGGGEEGRAAAALLVALLRAGKGLRYAGVRLSDGDDRNDDNSWTIEVSAAPTVVWAKRDPWETVVGAGAVRVGLQLAVRVSERAGRRSECAQKLLVRWQFYADPQALRMCELLLLNDLLSDTSCSVGNVSICSPDSVVVVTPQESAMALTVAREVERRGADVGLSLCAIVLSTSARACLRRGVAAERTLLSLEALEHGPVASGLTLVQPPPCGHARSCPAMLDHTLSPTLTLAPNFFLYKYAPRILRIVRRFLPELSILHDILQKKEKSRTIQEAACTWALENAATFELWFREKTYDEYSVLVYLCKNDPDFEKYKSVVKIMNETLQMKNETYRLCLTSETVDCFSLIDLKDRISLYISDSGDIRVAGAVAMGAGVPAAVDQANATHLTFVAYDAQPRRTSRGLRDFVATGDFTSLAAAFHNFFSDVQWKRIAILSTEDAPSNSFKEAFLADDCCTYHNITITGNATAMIDSLRSLQTLDAKIFVISAEANKTAEILCAAHDLGLTTHLHAWVVREWRVGPLPCDAPVQHYSISFSWRGPGAAATGWVPAAAAGDAALRESLQAKLGQEWPPHAAPLADALLTLAASFEAFILEFPHLRSNINGLHNLRSDSRIFHNLLLPGITQELRYGNTSSSPQRPLVFVERWRNGIVRTTVATWFEGGGSGTNLLNLSDADRAAMPIDGSRPCHTTRSGSAFSPRCHDLVWLALAVAVLLTPITALAARRLRAMWLERHDAALQARLLARRRRAAATLAPHLFAEDRLEIQEVIGVGRSGEVRAGRLRREGHAPLAVAVKSLAGGYLPKEEREFLREAESLSALQHPHVVRFVGVCAATEGLYLLTELALFGDLLQYLRARRYLAGSCRRGEAVHVSARALTRLGCEAASAVAYLATSGLVHRDVRAANCLVDARRTLLLADAGMLRRTSADSGEYVCRRRALFPVAWLAPEGATSGIFSPAGDVWALAVLFLELATLGERPHGTMPPHLVLERVRDGRHPAIPDGATPQMRSLVLACWRREPDTRPSAATVHDYLAVHPTALAPAVTTMHDNLTAHPTALVPAAATVHDYLTAHGPAPTSTIASGINMHSTRKL